jgi:alkylation response protein AidB-like acyl-CoA dehydrogenase
MTEAVTRIVVRDDATGLCYTFTRRDAWTLAALVAANDKGVTPIERPAPRWSEYVRRLRKAGLIIETIPEKHGGPYSGTHGRYVLRTKLTVLANDNAPR